MAYYAVLSSFFTFVVTFLACPRKVSKEGHPAKILYGMLGRPRYISETRPSGSDSPKCLTLPLIPHHAHLSEMVYKRGYGLTRSYA